MVERSPEKAGVGGSTPSLATTFSATYPLAFPHLGPLWVQFRPFTAHVLIGCELFDRSLLRLRDELLA